MEKLPCSVQLIEADYRSLCQAWKDSQPKPGWRVRKAFLYLIFFVLLAFPVFV